MELIKVCAEHAELEHYQLIEEAKRKEAAEEEEKLRSRGHLSTESKYTILYFYNIGLSDK